MIINETLRTTESKMKKIIESTRREFMGVRTSRASVGLVDNLKVDYFGVPTSLKQLAAIAIPQPRLIVIQPWDKSVIGAIEKSILQANLGITPVNDGKVIRITIPSLTEERREELVKVLRKIAEDGKVAIRIIRRDALESVREGEKKGSITEDERFKVQDKLQRFTDQYVNEVDRILLEKEKETREV
ncbi:MAG: ribosome recycling factor [Candidatus Omnitrophota bacterium]|nr:ribosome recycling factor [Candidatus Omnitrophota bacterium]